MSIRQKEEQQLQRDIEQYGELRGRDIFLNNFHFRLPGYRPFWMKPDGNTKNREASEKLRSQTFGEFFQTIDRVITEVGIDPKRFTELSRHRDIAWYDLALEVYYRLRELGYKHYPDLTS